MNRLEAKDILAHTIIKVLEEYPDLAGDAATSISIGVSNANKKLAENLSQAKLALAVSLALLPPNRITDENKRLLELVVAKSLKEDSLSQSEMGFLANIMKKV